MTFETLLGKRRRIKKPLHYLIDWEKGSRSKLQAKVKNFLKVFWDGDVVFDARIVGQFGFAERDDGVILLLVVAELFGNHFV